MISLFIDSKGLYQFIQCNRIVIPLANTESQPRFFGYRLSKNNGDLIVGYNSVVCLFVVINNSEQTFLCVG